MKGTMKLLKNSLSLLLMSVLFVSVAMGQTKTVAQEADELFEQMNFSGALEQYEKAYNSVKSNKAEKNRIYFRMGECYRLMHNYPRAEKIYKRLLNSKYYETEPILYFHLAEMCRFNSNFDEADGFYEKYLEIVPSDRSAQDRRKSLIEVNELFNARTRHVLVALDSASGLPWNTDNNDWAPRFIGEDTNRLIFTSSRQTAADAELDLWTGEGFAQLYTVYRDRRGKWSTTPELFDESGVILTPDQNEGEACFSPDGSVVYFNRCDNSEGKILGCYIYYSKKKSASLESSKAKDNRSNDKNQPKGKSREADSEWETPVKIHLGDSNFNYLYPAISSDGLTLYFSSDLPGGYGSYDIWVATRKSIDEPFGKPKNMGGRINTPRNELYPVLRNDSTLYLSSDGLQPSVGGLDLFKATISQSGRILTQPENLGVPLNSSYDEMSIVFYPGEHYMLERGYLSSNRLFTDPHNRATDKKGKRTKPANDDLYYFELPPLLYSIEGTIRDEKSMQLIENAKVKIVGSKGSEYETYSDDKGFYRFGVDQIKRDEIYKMYVSKVDYFTVEGSESTCGYNTHKDIVHDFRMEPVPKQPVILPEIRYDLAKWDLKEEFMDSLMDLYLVMVNNPGVVVEIRAHTDCRPFIGLTNDTLSQRRAQSVVDYLINRGIERDRLVAKGYGERIPRRLDRDMTVTINGTPYTFSEGTLLECEYISTLSGDDRKEAAHMLNRRIEFLILRDDFVSKLLVDNMASETPLVKVTEDGEVIDLVNRPIEQKEVEPNIIHDESIIPVTMIHSAKGEISCIVNGSLVPMLIDERYTEPFAIAWEEAMNFLYQRRINKEDFPDRDNAFDPEGNILDKATVIFKEMQIGQKKLKNVEVVVVKNVDYKFIVNRRGLAAFGEYEFDKQRGKLVFLDTEEY